MDKIQAIKIVRERTGLALRDAKELVEEIATLQVGTEVVALRAECRELYDRLEVAQEDMKVAIRLVEYFVRHPAEFDKWKTERASAAREG